MKDFVLFYIVNMNINVKLLNSCICVVLLQWKKYADLILKTHNITNVMWDSFTVIAVKKMNRANLAGVNFHLIVFSFEIECCKHNSLNILILISNQFLLVLVVACCTNRAIEVKLPGWSLSQKQDKQKTKRKKGKQN